MVTIERSPLLVTSSRLPFWLPYLPTCSQACLIRKAFYGFRAILSVVYGVRLTIIIKGFSSSSYRVQELFTSAGGSSHECFTVISAFVDQSPEKFSVWSSSLRLTNAMIVHFCSSQISADTPPDSSQGARRWKQRVLTTEGIRLGLNVYMFWKHLDTF